MEKHASHEKYYNQQGFGKWHSWDSPIGLSLCFSIMLTSIGFFIFLLHLSGLF